MKILKSVLIVIALICLVEVSYSQDLLWQKRYICEQGRFYYPLINQIDDDILMVNLVRTSDTIKNGVGNTFLITRLNSDGDTLWNKRFVLSYYVDNNFDLLKYNNDSFMINGSLSYHYKKFYNALFNSSGELIEENYFDMTIGFLGGGDYIYISIFNDFDFMISFDLINNISKFYKSNKDYVLKDSLILNFDNEDTSIQYPKHASAFECKTRDKGYLILSYQIDIPLKFNYLIKTDSILNVQWIQKYNSKILGDDTSRFYFKYIIQKYDGSFLGILNNIKPLGDSTFAIIQYDSIGNILSIKFYGKKLMYLDSKGKTRINFMSVSTMANTSDSGFVLGMDYRFPTIAKFDKDGELEWLRSYSVPDTNLPLELEDIYQISDNNFIMSLTEFDDRYDAPPPGLPLNTYLYKISNNPADVKSNVKELQEVKIIPNPATDFISLQFPQSMNVSKNTKIEIFSILGNKVLETEYKDRIDVSGLSAGVYFVKVGDKVIKFVKM
jgi:hypothetical protein